MDPSQLGLDAGGFFPTSAILCLFSGDPRGHGQRGVTAASSPHNMAGTAPQAPLPLKPGEPIRSRSSAEEAGVSRLARVRSGRRRDPGRAAVLRPFPEVTQPPMLTWSPSPARSRQKGHVATSRPGREPRDTAGTLLAPGHCRCRRPAVCRGCGVLGSAAVFFRASRHVGMFPHLLGIYYPQRLKRRELVFYFVFL